jgi:alpha-amylase/alpha-mannosidase (GH57 family)
MSEKAFCVHGHFYQPPREDPLTGIIPVEDGAAPYSNWNERITDDCYRPNAQEGNFGNISFNLGPTLSEWLELNHPAILNRIAEDDRYNFSHLKAGNAMAQPYHHTILPLASREDKSTQIRWGIEAYKKTYSRKPKGMWLPETAVDYETLEIMAANGIEFTILAPWQSDLPGLDSHYPYLVPLEGKRKMTAFFYDRELSSNISFNPGITANADEFVQKYLAGKFGQQNKDELLLVASDGELYGHHQQFRYKFLKQLFGKSLQQGGISPSVPEAWLKDHPAVEMCEIVEKTSWSCMHELKRWSGVCDCTPHSEWKEPLRMALNETAKTIDGVFLDFARTILENPWELRDCAIQVQQRDFNLQKEISKMGGKFLKTQELERLLLILRSEFERQRMFASCAWFFEDFDRIEPQNAVKYAANAIHLAQEATGENYSREVRPYFELVKSWRTGLSAGKVFQKFLDRVSSY